jgi:zeaxanthin glucosyltransferase
MAHFGVLCPPLEGHLGPMIALSRELFQRRHRITFFSIPDAEARIAHAGFDFHTIGFSDWPIGSLTQVLQPVGKSSGVSGFRATLKAYQRLMETVYREVPPAIKTLGIEMLITDQTERIGRTIAEISGTPFITVCNAMALNREIEIPPFFTLWDYKQTWRARIRNQFGHQIYDRLSKPMQDTINTYRREKGLPQHHIVDDSFSPLAQISQQPKVFDFPRTNLPQHFHYVGPMRTEEPSSIPFPYGKLTGQPLIYASIGTIQSRSIGIFQKIAEACTGLNVQLVLSLGGNLSVDDLPSLPGKPLIVDYAPQADLLSRAKLCITHAGLNTTLEALTHGVPLIAIPITNDQPGVAARIAYTGTGEVIPLPKLNSSDLRKAIERVLTQDSYRLAALKIGDQIQLSGGVTCAADIVEAVASTMSATSPILKKSGKLL